MPLSGGGTEVLRELDANISQALELRGEHFLDTLARLKQKWELFNSSASPTAAAAAASAGSEHWIGCQGSAANRRGYTCGLWTLFHFITVQAALEAPVVVAQARPARDDPLETLRAIHGYVKYFFGCSDCSQHFQTMADARRLWDVSGRDEAVLWLWRAHNEVNARLAGDATEDAAFPKVQWPTVQWCERCVTWASNESAVVVVQEPNWSEPDVLQLLRQVYAAENVSHYGQTTVAGDEEGGAYASRPQRLVVERRLLDGVFTDLDMRMGILLYLFCIGMMVVAVKMFMRRRGYRKKMYTHDFLGKV